jgi:hypothetical protein
MLDARTLERLEAKIIPEPNSGCWLWLGSISYDGYARARGPQGRLWQVHRLMYEHYLGKIPEGLVTDHLCRVRCCVNPRHLEIVSRAENVRRGISLSTHNRNKTHCPNGHPYAEGNLRISRGKDGCLRRACKKCGNARSRKCRAKAAAQ